MSRIGCESNHQAWPVMSSSFPSRIICSTEPSDIWVSAHIKRHTCFLILFLCCLCHPFLSGDHPLCLSQGYPSPYYPPSWGPLLGNTSNTPMLWFLDLLMFSGLLLLPWPPTPMSVETRSASTDPALPKSYIQECTPLSKFCDSKPALGFQQAHLRSVPFFLHLFLIQLRFHIWRFWQCSRSQVTQPSACEGSPTAGWLVSLTVQDHQSPTGPDAAPGFPSVPPVLLTKALPHSIRGKRSRQRTSSFHTESHSPLLCFCSCREVALSPWIPLPLFRSLAL